MASTRSMDGKCSDCGYSGAHQIVAMKSDGIGFCFGMECPECGKLVPEVAWQKYQKTGDVIVPVLRRTRGNEGAYTKGTRRPL